MNTKGLANGIRLKEQHTVIRDHLCGIIAMAEAASDGEWIDNKNGGVQSEFEIIADHVRPNDAVFIAEARTVTPQIAQALLLAVECAETWHSFSMIESIARTLGLIGKCNADRQTFRDSQAHK